MRQIASGSRFANAIRADLVAEIAALETADAAVNEADVALALARSKVRQLKLQLDKDRLGIHALLLGILGDKKAADSFFRRYVRGPRRLEMLPEYHGS